VGLIQQPEELSRKSAPSQHHSAVELLGQFLQGESSFFRSMERFPEPGGTAAIDPVVCVMKRDHAQPRCVQDLSKQDAAAAANQQVQVQASNRIDILL
jgi:hypothetical protein